MEESLYSLQNEKKEICYDFADMEKISNDFYSKFIGLENFTEDDKINIWNDTIYKDGSIFGTQFIWRRVTGQGRTSLKIFLTEKFTDYGKLLDMIIQAEQAIEINHENYKKIIKIMRLNKDLITKIIPGLTILRKNYVEDVFINLTGTINKILSNLDIFLESYKFCESKFSNNVNCFNSSFESPSLATVPLTQYLHPVVGTHSFHNPPMMDLLSMFPNRKDE